MSLMNVTAESLSRTLGKDVPPMYVVIAKHSVLGMDSESIKDVLGCDVGEIREVEQSDLYKEVRLHIGAIHAQMRVDQTTGWDAIEGIAISKLVERLPFERDSELLLRVAAVANKAQRRQGAPDAVLDPSKANGRTAIVLTQRLVQRITRTGQEELVHERELSIRDGSMSHPTFDEIDGVLSVSRQPALPRRMEIQTHSADPSFDELDAAMQERGY